MKKSLHYFLVLLIASLPCALLTLVPGMPLFAAAEASAPETGSIVVFGHFEQDNDPDNGPEPVEWLVLDVREDTALLISLRGLECLPYAAENSVNIWRDSSLRAWLNGVFKDSAFTPEEQSIILPTMVANGMDQSPPNVSKTGGEDTEDHVFLLSYAEMMRYFPDRAARACQPSPYAVARGVMEHARTGNCDWWLRSPGDGGRAAIVTLDTADFDVMFPAFTGTAYAVRPALWIDLSAKADH